MSIGLETQKSFVNTWECDENAHLNVQFYWKRFGDAGKVFAHCTSNDFQRWTDRHVRYHGELLSGAVTVVNSTTVENGNALVHVMTDGDGKLSATAVDRYAQPLQAADFTNDPVYLAASPRSLPSEPLTPVNTDDVIKSSHGMVSHLSVVTPAECDEEGILLDQYYISRFSEAASHFWNHLGISIGWLLERNLGSVAVEMKATRHVLPRIGMITEVVTWLGDVSEKTFVFHHQVRDLKSDEVLYNGAVTALVIDMIQRKTVLLPDKIRRLA